MLNWTNQAANVIQKLILIFLLLSLSGIVKAGSNTFYKYEYEYEICALIKPKQASVNRWVDKQVKKNHTGNLKNHLWSSSCALKKFF